MSIAESYGLRLLFDGLAEQRGDVKLHRLFMEASAWSGEGRLCVAEFGAELMKAVILRGTPVKMRVLVPVAALWSEMLRGVKILAKGLPLELCHLARVRTMAPLELKVVLDRFVEHSHA